MRNIVLIMMMGFSIFLLTALLVEFWMEGKQGSVVVALLMIAGVVYLEATDK